MEASLERSMPNVAFVCSQCCRSKDSQPNQRQALFILQCGKEYRTPELVKELSFNRYGRCSNPWDMAALTDIPAPDVPETSLELSPPITLTFPTILRVPSGRDSNKAPRSGLEQVSSCGESMPRQKGTNSPD